MAKAIISGISTTQSPDEEKTPESLGLIIFGASGDLTERKLIPALFNLWIRDQLPERWYVFGVSLVSMEDQGFREIVRGVVEKCQDHFPLPRVLLD